MLKEENCAVPRKGGAPLSLAEAAALADQIPDWRLIEQGVVQRLERTFKFKNFVSAFEFTNRIGEIAEQQDHHPALLTEWGKVTVTWWTHAVNGLHLNDFIMAAKSDAVYQDL